MPVADAWVPAVTATRPRRGLSRKPNGYVRTKPHTKCTVPVATIHHSTDFRYKSFIWWKLRGTKNATSHGVASQQDKKTGWGSTTLGRIVYGGKTYYARVYPARVSLNCGG